MIPFDSSSRGGRGQINPDGSYSVYCYQCRDFIGTSFTKIHRALCVVCQYAEEGKVMTEEQINMYRASKMGRSQVGLIVVPDEGPKVLGIPKKKFTLRSLGNGILSAIGSFALGQPPNENKAQESVKIAKAKRRGRLFEHVDLGSMNEVDGKLKEPK
jgi:hypothetical protein